MASIDGIQDHRSDETVTVDVDTPELHDACGHFHWDHEGGCPEAPCGSFLCCVN